MVNFQAHTAGLPRPQVLYDADRLCSQFPSVPVDEVVRILIDARRGIDLFGLSREEERDMAEKIAVEQLRQLVGESTALAAPRLDPETHIRRMKERPRAEALVAVDEIA
jgi:hypothetical protein